MAWDISLREHIDHSGKLAILDEPHREGSLLQMGGCKEAKMSVTYNYGQFFHFKTVLNRRRARDTIKELEEAVERLGTRQSPDYWAKTPGNAGYACSILLGWARQHPDYFWHTY